MADLPIWAQGPTGLEPALNLWCTPCGQVHLMLMPDVERVLYALGLMLPVARQEVEDGGREHPHPECPLHVLRLATSSSWYGPPVAEAVANREQAGTDGRCGERNPDYPDEPGCTLAAGHGPVILTEDGVAGGTVYAHARPEGGAWWSHG